MADYVFFDFDGTICDTAEGITKCMQYALRKMGIEATLSELMCFAGPPLTDMLKQVYAMSDEDAEKTLGFYRERYAPTGWKECRPFDGMSELVKNLRAAGKTIAITTSKPRFFTENILKMFNMYEDFDLICGSEFDGTRSKKWEVIDYALQCLNITPEQAIMVGDRKYDFIGARQCGVKCIGVRFGYAEPGELEAEGAEFIAETPQELYNYLVKC